MAIDIASVSHSYMLTGFLQMSSKPRSKDGNCKYWAKTGPPAFSGYGPDKCIFYCCYNPRKKCSAPPNSVVQLYYCWGGQVYIRACEVLIYILYSTSTKKCTRYTRISNQDHALARWFQLRITNMIYNKRTSQILLKPNCRFINIIENS